MCEAVSGITKERRHDLHTEPATWNHSHTEIMRANAIPDRMIGDSYRGGNAPTDGDYQSDVGRGPSNWTKRKPEWWKDDEPALVSAAREQPSGT